MDWRLPDTRIQILLTSKSFSDIFKWAIPGLFIFIFVFSIKLTKSKQMFFLNFRQWLDLNLGPLVSVATALPTEPNHCPIIFVLWKNTGTCYKVITTAK